MFSYSDFCSIGTAMILSATTFLMGVFFSNMPYDYHLLFNPNSTQEHFDLALRHYQILHETPLPVIVTLCVVAGIGLIGGTIKVFKPNPELQMFEYCSLGLYVLAICVFLTNVKTGIDCSVSHNWGEVTENQGLAVIASSNIILLVMFAGVIILQIGLWYSNWDLQKRLKEFYAEEEREAANAGKKTEKVDNAKKNDNKSKGAQKRKNAKK
ncbi:ALI_collapsed_G0008110.mRNA.1.CDS.1 [Saccharomyces cerevisiae]|nr:ALI_collapsed_G0008110.mRNA.1.CDS.1 [Saccharomyces cerevisiae]